MKLILPVVACALAGAARAQFYLAPDPATDDVMLFDANDGSLLNPSYIDLTPVGGSLPIEALQVNGEIWISDQSADSIFRFTLDGTTHLGTITGGLDNIRGIEFDGTRVYVSNSGTGNGAPGAALVMFDTSGNNLGSFPVGDPFDVIRFQGDLLVANIAGDNLDRYTTAGAFVSTFHDSDGINGVDFPEQIHLLPNGNVLCAGFTTPAAIYEYDSSGVQVFALTIPVSGGRGVAGLGNGNILYSDSTGVNVYDRVATTTTHVSNVQVRYFGAFTGTTNNSTPFCAGDALDPNVTTACPCGNFGASGNGCANSVNGAGANLTATGVPSFDTVVLHGSGMPASVSCIYLQGDAIDDAVFGDGVRCAGGTLLRLRTKTNVGGASSFPDSVETVTLAQRGGVVPGSGAVRFYQTYYRNAAALFCPPETFNVTNGWRVTW